MTLDEARNLAARSGSTDIESTANELVRQFPKDIQEYAKEDLYV